MCNLQNYSVTIWTIITINTIAITDSTTFSDKFSDNYPSKQNDVATCSTPNAHVWRLWVTTIQSREAAWATPLLWRPQVPVCVIPCSWERRNKAACPAVHWLQHCRTLGDSARVCRRGHVLSTVCRCCVQVVPRVGCRKTLVDRRYGEACRRSFKGRNLVACQFGEVPQGVYHCDHFSDCKESYLRHRTEPMWLLPQDFPT